MYVLYGSESKLVNYFHTNMNAPVWYDDYIQLFTIKIRIKQGWFLASTIFGILFLTNQLKEFTRTRYNKCLSNPARLKEYFKKKTRINFNQWEQNLVQPLICNIYSWTPCLGHFGFSKMNSIGQRLLEFCLKKNLCVTNLLFKTKLQHKVSRRHTRYKRWHN